MVDELSDRLGLLALLQRIDKVSPRPLLLLLSLAPSSSSSIPLSRLVKPLLLPPILIIISSPCCIMLEHLYLVARPIRCASMRV